MTRLTRTRAQLRWARPSQATSGSLWTPLEACQTCFMPVPSPALAHLVSHRPTALRLTRPTSTSKKPSITRPPSRRNRLHRRKPPKSQTPPQLKRRLLKRSPARRVGRIARARAITPSRMANTPFAPHVSSRVDFRPPCIRVTSFGWMRRRSSRRHLGKEPNGPTRRHSCSSRV